MWPFNVLMKVARKVEKRVTSAYYRHLLGRRGPFAFLVGKFVLRRAQSAGRTDAPRSREVWEEEYRKGEWDFLLELGQMSRNAILAAYVHQTKPRASVLDVGCGSGKFYLLLRPFGYGRFVGVDISTTALAPLLPMEDDATRFVCADAEAFEPEGTFDVIVFNESLYLFEAPLRVVERYAAALGPDGVILVSSYEGSTRAMSILRALKERYLLEDEIRVTHRATSWTCSVLRQTPNLLQGGASIE